MQYRDRTVIIALRAIRDLIRLELTPVPADAEPWERACRELSIQRAEDRILDARWIATATLEARGVS